MTEQFTIGLWGGGYLISASAVPHRGRNIFKHPHLADGGGPKLLSRLFTTRAVSRRANSNPGHTTDLKITV